MIGLAKSLYLPRPRLIAIGFCAALGILTAMGLLVYRNSQELIESKNRLIHTHALMQELEAIAATMVDVQTASRGYFITRQSRYLEPYENAIARFSRTLEALKELTSDNPRQQRRLAELEPVFSRAFVSARKTIELRSVGLDIRAATALMDEGKLATDEIRIGVGQMRAEEENLLAQRSATAEQSSFKTALTAVAGAILSFSILIATYYLLNKEIGQRIKAEDAVKALNQDLERHSSELERANKELEAFSYSVSHDLRAPLRAIDGFSQALLEDCGDSLDAEGRDYLDRVRAATQHMGQLIDDMLGLARVTRVEIRRESVDLTAMARSVAIELQQADGNRQVEFYIAEGLRATADSRLLRVALENLLSNAWKFTGKTPAARIEVGAGGANGQRAYFVRDNGAGFDMAYADKLFGVFQRLHAASEFKGTGIGLATVQRVIHRHGGRIWAEGRVGEGAAFYFTL